MSLQIVIDTCIATAAGWNQDSEESTKSRECLHAFFASDFRLVMSTKLELEWNRHSSKFSTLWRSGLQKRGRVISCEVNLTEATSDIENLACRKKDKKLMKEDVHLLVASWAYDKIVISRDSQVRRLYSEHKAQILHGRKVAWLDPIASKTCVISKIENGKLTTDDHI